MPVALAPAACSARGARVARQRAPAPRRAAARALRRTVCAQESDLPAESREELTDKIMRRKMLRGKTWAGLAKAMGGISPIYATAALLGQMRLTEKEAHAAAQELQLNDEEALLLQQIPSRGALPPGPPTDPLIYRFYELIQVYGPTWKELIQEMFGDGIMSAIDFDMTMERQPDPKGDRVKITFSGKFLPYKRY